MFTWISAEKVIYGIIIIALILVIISYSKSWANQ
jgi:cell division protein FtsL